LLDDPSLELNLIFIKVNYGKLQKYITTLEISDLLMTEAIGIITKAQNAIGIDNSSIGKLIKQKLNTVIEKNTGFKKIKNISNILERKSTSRDN